MSLYCLLILHDIKSVDKPVNTNNPGTIFFEWKSLWRNQFTLFSVYLVNSRYFYNIDIFISSTFTQ